jgi:hypothetical protein
MKYRDQPGYVPRAGSKITPFDPPGAKSPGGGFYRQGSRYTLESSPEPRSHE